MDLMVALPQKSRILVLDQINFLKDKLIQKIEFRCGQKTPKINEISHNFSSIYFFK